MMINTNSISGRTFCRIAPLIVCLFWTCAESAEGQTPVAGNNAVYNSTGNCSTSSQCAGSSAFVDAQVLGGWPGPWGRID